MPNPVASTGERLAPDARESSAVLVPAPDAASAICCRRLALRGSP
jgi:hypothetical protein